MIEINFDDVIRDKINLQKLLKDDVVIIKNAAPIEKFRKNLIKSLPKEYQEEIYNLYHHKIIPSQKAIYYLRNGLNLVRDIKYLSTLLYEFITLSFRDKSIVVDGGISRLLFPVKKYETLRSSFLFHHKDFQRERGSSDVETFMNGESNIHRDFNRFCSVDMFNLWIPMHDMEESEILSIYLDYRDKNIFDMDNTQKNRAILKNKLVFDLKFGDILLFHSEQLHHSPIRDLKKTIRHSFDFRVMVGENSDAGHYRENFDNLKNFYIPKKLDNIYKLKREKILSLEDENCNAKILFYKYKNNILSKEELFKNYQLLPFAEDRYVTLALYEIDDAGFISTIIDFVLQRTKSYFWIYKLYKLSLYSNQENEDLLKQAMELARKSPLDFSQNLQYSSYSKEIDYDFLLRKSQMIKKSLVIILQESIINIDLVLPKLQPSYAIAPIEMEKYLTYMKNIDPLKVYTNKIVMPDIKMFEKIYVILSRSEEKNKQIYKLFQESNVKEYTVLNEGQKVHTLNNRYISPLAIICESVDIDGDVEIGDFSTIDAYTTIKNNVTIGRYSGISTHVHIYNDCFIGKFCAIGANTVIAGPPHHVDTLSISNKLTFKNLKPFRNYTTIGHDAWVGANCTIKANISIGNGAVIGANSFVNRDIPPYSIVYGSPAKVYSYRFNKSKIEELLELQWWEIEDIVYYEPDSNINNAIKEIKILKELDG